MSLIGSLNAAVGGMAAQAVALSSISDNVANSQTVGFKQTDTAFNDYVTQSTTTLHAPGAVVALPEYTNSIQGTVSQVSNPTSLAISGNGFFPVQLPTSATTFSAQQYYTRAGDFTADKNGHLINSTGYVLAGWPATSTGTFNSNALGPIQVSQAPSAPVPTSNITLAANLPAVPPVGTTSYTSTAQVNDASGNVHNVTMNWAQVPTNASLPIGPTNLAVSNQWDLTITASGATATTATTGPMRVTFGNGSAAQPAGTIASIVPSTILAQTVTDTQAAAVLAGATVIAGVATGGSASLDAALATATAAVITGAPGLTAAGLAVPTATAVNATLNLSPNFGFVNPQPIALNLGQFGTTAGVTQFAGTSYAVATQTQDGSAQGNYSSVTIQPTGDVIINYDNGTTKTVAQIPLANFASPDSLQQQSGQAFIATIGSGAANVVGAGTGGTGTMVVGAEEGSNVDIATQFTQMIVAQRAYTANSKVITTANSMMQDALNMIQG
jgi:flagellar hook protein FlgE